MGVVKNDMEEKTKLDGRMVRENKPAFRIMGLVYVIIVVIVVLTQIVVDDVDNRKMGDLIKIEEVRIFPGIGAIVLGLLYTTEENILDAVFTMDIFRKVVEEKGNVNLLSI